MSAIIKDNSVYVAWAGDSRALIVGRSAVQKLSDPPHDTKNQVNFKKNILEDFSSQFFFQPEIKRITDVGGLVFNFQGQDRVNGLLNITRSFGKSECIF